MNNAVDADFSLLCKFSPDSTTDWPSVCAAHHNVLLEGPGPVMKSVLRLLKPHLREPVVWRHSGVPFELPTIEVGTLVLQDVGDLRAEEQTRLYRWLDDNSQRTQIVSTTAHPLFALVACGLFDAALYYRLNITLLQLQVANDPELYSRDARADREPDRLPGTVSAPQSA